MDLKADNLFTQISSLPFEVNNASRIPITFDHFKLAYLFSFFRAEKDLPKNSTKSQNHFSHALIRLILGKEAPRTQQQQQKKAHVSHTGCSHVCVCVCWEERKTLTKKRKAPPPGGSRPDVITRTFPPDWGENTSKKMGKWGWEKSFSQNPERPFANWGLCRPLRDADCGES